MLNAGVADERAGKPPWDIALQILGAAAGLAAFAYLVGAVVVWLRLNVAGYAADLGLDLTSDARVVSIGVRGIAVVALTAGLLLALTHFYVTRWATPLGVLIGRRWWIGLVIGVIFVLMLFASFLISGRVFLATLLSSLWSQSPSG